LNALLKPHVYTFVPLLLPNINDDESTHSDNGSYFSYEYDSVDDEHGDDEPP